MQEGQGRLLEPKKTYAVYHMTLSEIEDPYSMEHYNKKFQVVIGRQAYNARQLARRAALRGHDASSQSRRVEFHRRKYDDMYREPLTDAQRDEILAKTGHVKDADGMHIKRSEASRLRKIAKRLQRMNEGRPIVGPNPLQSRRDPNLDRQLLEAAERGHTATVGRLLERGAAVEAKDYRGWTALMYAVINGYTETVGLLLDRGADVNAKGNSGGTALMVAAWWNSHTEILRLLLERGADIEAKSHGGWTALMAAARFGSTETVGQLLEWGADVEATGPGGETALTLARDQATAQLLSRAEKRSRLASHPIIERRTSR